MKTRHIVLSTAIASALCSFPGVSSLAMASSPSASGGEALRITQTINNQQLFTVPKTNLAFLSQASSTAVPIADTAPMNHLQLILKPSAARTAALEALIANQHNPRSAQFDRWLTPQEFGQRFGVVDGDLAAVTSWLTSQGFTVNNVYPNKTQIDFSGTVAQVKQAFHTQEKIYTINNQQHVANATNISIPAALEPVVAGVMGLNDFHAKSQISNNRVVQWDKLSKSFVPLTKRPTIHQGTGQVVQINPNERGLAPNDMATIYGIRTLRNNGVTGAGINIAVVEDQDMIPSGWTNFVSTFNLGQYGGTFTAMNPQPPSGPSNCMDPAVAYEGQSLETVLDSEWATAIAPGANIWVASCSDYQDSAAGNYSPIGGNFFEGLFIASSNVVNGSIRPDVISTSYGFGEFFVDSASKTAIDQMWAQADAEGISVFVSTGDSGSNPSFNGGVINGQGGNTAIDANALATSPHVTGVGGTDFADILEGTTGQYFAPTPSVVGGSALSYVPEIPWNDSCGNGVAAKAFGFSNAVDFCNEGLLYSPAGGTVTSEAGSGGPSSVDAKPVWQRQIYNAARDQSRDLPDVSLFADSFNFYTGAIICTDSYPCTPGFTGHTDLIGGTSLSSPMFAGIQALIDQGLHARGLPVDQGNAAPTLYALAANEYGGSSGPVPASLAACNANNGANGTTACVFHNVTSGSNSTNCYQEQPQFAFSTPNCYFYGTIQAYGQVEMGLTTTDAAPTSYGVSNKAYGAQPGWSFATGLGSVNATNLMMAWRAFVNAPSATASTH